MPSTGLRKYLPRLSLSLVLCLACACDEHPGGTGKCASSSDCASPGDGDSGDGDGSHHGDGDSGDGDGDHMRPDGGPAGDGDGDAGPEMLHTPSSVHNIDPGDDWNAASDATLITLAGMFDPKQGKPTSGTPWKWAWTSTVEGSLANYERSNGALFPDLFEASYELNKAGNFLTDPGYDDEAWWLNAWLRAYDDTGDGKYLDMAKVIFNDMTSAWDESTCGGGIWWNRGNHYKNAITVELFFLAATELHNRTPGDTQYLDWSHKIWDWLSNSGMINDQHLVNDGLTDDCKNNGQTTWTYNQGVLLGALVELYRATGDDTYLMEAEKLADASTTLLANDAGVLREPCETQGSCNEDQALFKGIYLRHLVRLYDATGKREYGEFLRKNARSLWNNSRSGNNELGLTWTGPFDQADASRQASGVQALLALATPWRMASPFVRAAGGSSFNHDMGHAVGDAAWGCDLGSCPQEGLMQTGPYLASLIPGDHSAHFQLTVSHTSQDDVALATLQVVASNGEALLGALDVNFHDFARARVAQDFAVPFSSDAGTGALEFRVQWHAAEQAPELTVRDVSVDSDVALSAINMKHACGRADVLGHWTSDRQHDADSCEMIQGGSHAFEPGSYRAQFELSVDDFSADDALVATLSVFDRTTQQSVSEQKVSRSAFKTRLFHALPVTFTSEAQHSYDFVVRREASDHAPRITARAIAVERALTDMHVDLPFDRRGLGTGAGDADVDGSGGGFDYDALSRLLTGSRTFAFGPRGSGNNVLSATGQTLSLPQDAHAAVSVHVLLLAVNGSQPGAAFKLTYADGSSSDFTRDVSDWAVNTPARSETYAVAAPSRWSKTGRDYGNFHLFAQTFTVEAGKQPSSLVLPNNPNIKIFAVTIARLPE
jgi:predicted alpha-1,6-mannanase (GH76 family)